MSTSIVVCFLIYLINFRIEAEVDCTFLTKIESKFVRELKKFIEDQEDHLKTVEKYVSTKKFSLN